MHIVYVCIPYVHFIQSLIKNSIKAPDIYASDKCSQSLRSYLLTKLSYLLCNFIEVTVTVL